MPPKLTEDVRSILTCREPAHLVTLNPDGSPQVSVVWIGLERDEIETGQLHLAGLDGYLAITGVARISQGAPQLLRRLAAVYLGPGTELPWTQDESPEPSGCPAP